MKIHLISTYEMGRQPFGLASPMAWLQSAGFEVSCTDCAIDPFPAAQLVEANLVAFYLPMHTATRLAVPLARRALEINPQLHLCFYGLYAPLNADYLRSIGATIIIGGEYETQLVAACSAIRDGLENSRAANISLNRQQFLQPERSGLPALHRYANLIDESRDKILTTGYTQTTRGCKHLCRHCPIVPIYNGHFRVIQRDIVLADIRQQVAAGAQHITFGDPDFFNGPGHVVPIIEALYAEFPELSYDVTIKVAHLLKYRKHLPILRKTGCAFVTTAVESFDDRVLEVFDKRHTHQQFAEMLHLFRELDLAINPTFVAFSPWLDLDGYLTFLANIADYDLIENVAPIQLAIRLLIPQKSRLLELPETREFLDEYDQEALVYRWHHPDPQLDTLQLAVADVVEEGTRQKLGHRRIFEKVWQTAYSFAGKTVPELNKLPTSRSTIPYLNEPWYC